MKANIGIKLIHSQHDIDAMESAQEQKLLRFEKYMRILKTQDREKQKRIMELHRAKQQQKANHKEQLVTRNHHHYREESGSGTYYE